MVDDKDTKSAGERALRRLLRAASARPEELPPLTPHLLTRLKADARAAGRDAAAHPIGLAAWRMLPAFALLVAVVAGFAAYESVEVRKERAAAMASLMDPSSGGDLLFATTLLGGGGAP